MNKLQWQNKHGFTEEDMDLIESCKEIFKGSITMVNDHTWDKEKIIIENYNKINLSRR
jgi:hypothetical protein